MRLSKATDTFIEQRLMMESSNFSHSFEINIITRYMGVIQTRKSSLLFSLDENWHRLSKEKEERHCVNIQCIFWTVVKDTRKSNSKIRKIVCRAFDISLDRLIISSYVVFSVKKKREKKMHYFNLVAILFSPKRCMIFVYLTYKQTHKFLRDYYVTCVSRKRYSHEI